MSGTGPTASALERWLHEHLDDLVAARRHLHAHPEVSGEEYATTEFVAERLAIAGLSTRRLASGTGLVCDLDDGSGRPRVAFRADIDALAMDDEKDVPYRSQVPGVAHACGHDVHTTIALGAALFLSHHREAVPGPVRFVFQPAEERVPGGALDVLADDGLVGVDTIFGFHCDPKLDVGRVGLRAGSITSAADMATISISGPGGHTARPSETVDLVDLVARIVTSLPHSVAEAVGSPEQVRLVFGAVHAGDAANVIPSHGQLRAAVRTPSLEVWERLPSIVRDRLTDLLDGTGAEFELDYTHGVPPVVNDAGVTASLERAACAELGVDSVTAAVQSWGGDDFAWYTRAIPGSYVRLGVRDPDAVGAPHDLHVGRFDVDERSIAVGVRLAVAGLGALSSESADA